MTVLQLIELLKGQPLNATVVVRGGHESVVDVASTEHIMMARTASGDYVKATSWEPGAIHGVLIVGVRRDSGETVSMRELHS